MVNGGIILPLQHLVLSLMMMSFFFFVLFELKRITRFWFIIYLVLSMSSSYLMFDIFRWFTDEAIYTPTFYNTILQGRNPYTTPVLTSLVPNGITWSYLPLIGFIQIPYIGELPPEPWYFYYLTISLFTSWSYTH